MRFNRIHAIVVVYACILLTVSLITLSRALACYKLAWNDIDIYNKDEPIHYESQDLTRGPVGLAIALSSFTAFSCLTLPLMAFRKAVPFVLVLFAISVFMFAPGWLGVLSLGLIPFLDENGVAMGTPFMLTWWIAHTLDERNKANWKAMRNFEYSVVAMVFLTLSPYAILRFIRINNLVIPDFDEVVSEEKALLHWQHDGVDYDEKDNEFVDVDLRGLGVSRQCRV